MTEAADSTFVSQTGHVAESLGKTAQQAAPLRKALIDNGVIVVAGHGKVRFNIPYLRAYVGKPDAEDANNAPLETWGV